MAAAVQVDEEAAVREVLASLMLPAGVSLKDLYQDEDHMGKPALRIMFQVSRKVPLTKKRVAELVRLREAVRDQILDRGGINWPYVTFLDAR